VFTNAIAGRGFRLAPTYSPIRYGLVFPSGCLFIGIVNDKGRYRSRKWTIVGIDKVGDYPSGRLDIRPSRRGNILAVPISDTSPSAQALQLQIQRGMPGEQRLLLALEMSLFARELAKERIRREYPEWSDAQVARELLRLAFLTAPVPAGLR
jgi:hypothetical protein